MPVEQSLKKEKSRRFYSHCHTKKIFSETHLPINNNRKAQGIAPYLLAITIQIN